MLTGSLSDISHKKRLMVALFALTAIVGVIFIYAKMRVQALSSLTFDQVDDANLLCIKELLSGQEIDENLDKFYSVEIRTILFDHIKTEYTAVTAALKSLGIILVFINMCEKLIKTMEKGEMYASMGPLFKEVSIEENRLHVECSEVAHIYLYNGGKRPGRLNAAPGESLTCADFEIDGNARYIRVSIRDAEGRWADTRGFFRDEMTAAEKAI